MFFKFRLQEGGRLFYWASARKKSQRNRWTGWDGVHVGLDLFIALEGMLIVFPLSLLLQSGTIEESVENIHNFVPIFSWLVTDAIGFYFANPTSAAE